jgi:hypothetical protein
VTDNKIDTMAQQFGIAQNTAPEWLRLFVREVEIIFRAEQHAECVRLLREEIGFGYVYAADWLEARKP